MKALAVPIHDTPVGLVAVTIRHIHTFRELRDLETPPKSGRMWECGCECQYGTVWYPCRFHDGFNTAAVLVGVTA